MANKPNKDSAANDPPKKPARKTAVKKPAAKPAAPEKNTVTASTATPANIKLSPRNLARVEGWGMAVSSFSHQFQPTSVPELASVFALARAEGRSVALRGTGNSYGDASLNEQGIVLDLSRMNRILAWDAASGVIDVEPGATLEQIWKHIIPDGWWPTVVSGTMKTTAGGCASMNIHGKNNYKAGPFGDCVLEFDIVTPSGELLTCSRDRHADLFHAAISGFGMLGCFTRLRLQTKKVHSGQLRVESIETRSIPEMIDIFEDRHTTADYLVGWIDCIAGGRRLGRGIIHSALYLKPGEDPNPAAMLNVPAQELPDRIMGLVPKSMSWMLMTPLVNNLGMRLVNAAKIHSSRLKPPGHTYLQSHAGFAFLLDYVPNWKLSYGRGGLIQYQSFLPKKVAAAVFEDIIVRAQRAGLPSYLGVLKKHRPDPFLLTHALDGYSLALDFRVTKKNRHKLWQLAAELDEVVLANGGRFYFAKDATLRKGAVEQFFPPENLAKFIVLKRQFDPENLLQTDLSRRVFGEKLG